MKFWVQVTILFLVAFFPAAILVKFFNAGGDTLQIAWIIIGVLLVLKFFDDMVVKVEPNTATVIKNEYTGMLRVVGPGWHVKYAWPEKKFMDISLKKRALTIPEDKYETHDSVVLISGTLEYRPDFGLLLKFILISDDDLVKDIIAQAKSIIGEILSEKEAETAIKQRPQIQEDIYASFKSEIGSKQLEDAYGIEIIGFSIHNIKLDPELQKARTQEDIEKRQKKSEMTEQEAFVEQVKYWMQELDFTAEQAADYVLRIRRRGTKQLNVNIKGEGKSATVRPRIDLPTTTEEDDEED